MEKVRVKPNLMIYKRLPMRSQNENIQTILDLNKSNKEFQIEFLTNNNIEKKLETCRDDSMGNFIKCSYNKLGDSFRSPWTNKFFPESPHPVYPPEIFREFEKSFNEIYALYAKLYYGNEAVSSVYIWEQGDSLENGFNIALLIDNQRELANDKSGGILNSVNIINAKFIKEKEKADMMKVVYKISTTLTYNIQINNFIQNDKQTNIEEANSIGFSGTINKQVEEGAYVKSLLDVNGHVEKIGKLIEYVENNIRASLDEVHLRKAKEIIENTRKKDNVISIPVEFLKTKDQLLFSMQEYWQSKSNSESAGSANVSLHSRTNSTLSGIENMAMQNTNNLNSARQ